MKTLASAITLILLGSVVGLAADRTAEDRQQAERERYRLDVRSILRAEQNGSLTDRERLLKPILNSENAPDEAYWQAGYIRQGDDWISVKDRPLTSEEEAKLKEYAKVRSQVEDSPENHWQLARWCYEHELFPQCRAHLMAILLDYPDHAGLREMLGYQKIGNRWMNAEDYEAAVREADRLAKELAEWGPQVASIRDDLSNPIPLRRSGAKKRLQDIRDVAAVPALEMILLPASDEAAALCVEQLCEIDHRRASIALCKAAMFLPDSSAATKQAAIEELKTRPYEDYVPVLLGKMQTPMTARYWYYHVWSFGFNRGPFNMPHPYHNWHFLNKAGITIKSENQYELQNYTINLLIRDIGYHPGLTANHKDLSTHGVAEEISRAVYERNTITPMQLLIRNMNKSEFDFLQNSESEQQEIIDQMLSYNRIIEKQNVWNVELNDRITSLMGNVTGLSNHESPDFWWDWWSDRIEVATDQKIIREVEEVVREEFFHYIPSCFVAGTPVWTERGPQPIEQLRVGDRALAKNVETGELSYQPIIRTTTREPKPLVTIDLGVEEITSTGGHPFWVAGEGWIRARELEAGQLLHTPTGALPIESVTEVHNEKTYNLVVDSSHTYFVGMSQVLVHDVSITSPTDAVVPGLIER